MIYFVAVRATSYTHKSIAKRVYPKFRTVTYDQLFKMRKVRKGTWIFTDFDRLNVWELELAARMYRELKAAKDVRVLNDPARVADRFTLLKRLKKSGVNSFDVWRIEDLDRVDKYPVFIRQNSMHRGPISKLLKDRAALIDSTERILADGYPALDLMVVEYAAEALQPNLFRKMSVFRVGERYVRTLCVHDPAWNAKYGKSGIAGQNLYDFEYINIKRNELCEPVQSAFELSGLEYGRADYTIVKGRIEVFEINSNPDIQPLLSHPFPVRLAGDRLWLRNLGNAFSEIDDAGIRQSDSPIGERKIRRFVRFRDWRLRQQRRKDRFVARSRWLP